jgi:hypothetical protein
MLRLKLIIPSTLKSRKKIEDEEEITEDIKLFGLSIILRILSGNTRCLPLLEKHSARKLGGWGKCYRKQLCENVSLRVPEVLQQLITGENHIHPRAPF